MLINSPLEQFCISSLKHFSFLGYDISFTNASLFLLIVFSLLYLILRLSTMNTTLIPNNWQLIIESTYEFIQNMIEEQIGSKGRGYFPFIFVMFTFILASNLLGMVPYTFTVTSHIFLTFA